MSNILIVLAVLSAIVLPAITTATVHYLLGAAAFVAVAALAHRFLMSRELYRQRVRRLA